MPHASGQPTLHQVKQLHSREFFSGVDAPGGIQRQAPFAAGLGGPQLAVGPAAAAAAAAAAAVSWTGGTRPANQPPTHPASSAPLEASPQPSLMRMMTAACDGHHTSDVTPPMHLTLGHTTPPCRCCILIARETEVKVTKAGRGNPTSQVTTCSHRCSLDAVSLLH
jgi:hypothetical protein